VASNWLQNTRYGDVNFDGIVNGQDVALIASNWLATSSGGAGGASSVPEPSALILAVLGGLALLVAHHAKSHTRSPR
jgi:hypothetical protein